MRDYQPLNVTMDTPIGLEGTIGSDFTLDSQDDLTQFSQLESIGDSEQGSTTAQLPDPASLLVPPEGNEETLPNQVKEDGRSDKQNALQQSDGPTDVNQPAAVGSEIDKMDIDTLQAEMNIPQSTTELEPDFKATSDSAIDKPPTNTIDANIVNKEDPLAKIKQIQLLPELYSILFDFTNGKIHPRDFDKYIANLRSKLNNLKLYILEIDGIDVSPETMMNEINQLKENNSKKQSLLDSFKDKVKNDFV